MLLVLGGVDARISGFNPSYSYSTNPLYQGRRGPWSLAVTAAVRGPIYLRDRNKAFAEGSGFGHAERPWRKGIGAKGFRV